MAEVFANFDFADLGKTIEKAEEELSHLAQISDNTVNSINNAFKSLTLEGKLDAATKKIREFRDIIQKELGPEALRSLKFGVSKDFPIREGIGKDIKNIIDAISNLTDGVGKLQYFLNGVSGVSDEVFGNIVENLHRSSFEIEKMAVYYGQLEAKGVAATKDSNAAKSNSAEWQKAWNERQKIWQQGFEDYDEQVRRQAQGESESAREVSAEFASNWERRQAIWEQGFDNYYEKLMQQAKQESDIARANSEEFAKNFEARYRSWEQMFDYIAQEEEKQKLSTPEGALIFANEAKTQNEMGRAMKYLETARKNLDISTSEGLAMNDKLIKKYGELKTTLEELEGKTKDQNTLVATESAKYARLLRELNKYKKSLKELRETEAYKAGDTRAMDAEQSLQNEIDILEKRKHLYSANKESIRQAETQVSAEIAQENLIIFQKEQAEKERIRKEAEKERAKREEERAKIAQKYEGMSPAEARESVEKGWSTADIERYKKAITELTEEKYALDKADDNYAENVRELDALIATNKHNVEELTKAEKEYNKTTDGAMRTARRAKSLKEMQDALKNLAEARNSVNMREKEGKKEYIAITKEMDRLRKEIGKYTDSLDEVNSKHSELTNTGEQLKRALTNIFTVSAIRGYLKNVMEVRGEFELQQKSLQALLQNKEEADKLWDKTIKLAIKSPYTIRDLVKYTKQLAAYRIESEKLYDTTNMLADISAGLGVDMDRLILAYGQVKAANYLRGTELRQFSEAGINVLEELAKYFTEIEGRAISVGDVFARVSERLVSFADVEEVLNRVTEEGGMFYNMQEIQAQTLKGLQNKLRDTVDVMLNEIGEDYEEVIKNAIKWIITLVEHWRDLIPVVKAAGVAVLAYKGYIGLASLASSKMAKTLGIGVMQIIKTTKATKSAAIAVNTLNAAVTGLAMASGIAALAALAYVFYKIWDDATKAERAAKRLSKELNKIKIEDKGELQKELNMFESLVERYRDANAGTEERKRIISQLNSQYGEYLGFIVDETTAYEDLAAASDKVVYSLTQRARANTLEKMYNKATESYLDNIQSSRDKISESFDKGAVRSKNKEGKYVSFIPTKSEIEAFFQFVEKKSNEASRDSYFWGDAKSWAKEFFGKDITMSTADEERFANLFHNYRAITKSMANLESELNDVYTSGIFSTSEHLNEIKKHEQEVASFMKSPAFKKMNEAEQESWVKTKEAAKIKITLKYTTKLEPGETQEQFNKRLDDIVMERMKNWNKHQDVVKRANAEIVKKYGKNKNISLLNILYQEQDVAGQKNIKQITEEFAAGYKAAEEQLKRLENLKKEGAVYSNVQSEELEKQMQQQKDYMEAYKFGLQLYGAEDLLDAKNKELNNFKKRISLLEEMRREYVKQRKYFTEEGAASNVIDAYGEAWEAVGGSVSEIISDMLSDGYKLADFIETVLLPLTELLPQKQREAAKAAATNAMGGFRTHAQDEELAKANKMMKDNINELFEAYQYAEELRKLGVNTEFAQQLFGFEAIDAKGLRRKLESMAGMYIGTELESFYDDALNKLNDMEENRIRDNIKKYLEYTRDSIGDRAKIKLEELKKLQEIEDSFSEGEAKKRAQKGVRKEASEALQKYDWERFKSSEMFVTLFDDIEHASDVAINYSIEQLEKFRNEWKDMPVSEAQEMIEKINELKIALTQNMQPRKAAKSLISDLEKEMKARGIDASKSNAYAKLRDSISSDIANKDETISATEKEVSDLETMVQLFHENKLNVDSLTESQKKLYDTIFVYGDMSDTVLNAEVDRRKNVIKSLREQIAVDDSLIKKMEALSNIYQVQEEVQQKWIDTINGYYDTIRDLASILYEISDAEEVWWDFGESMINITSQAMSFHYQLKQLEVQATLTGVKMNAAFGPIGGILLGVQALVELLKALSDSKQAKINERLEEQKEIIDDLQTAYEKLEKNIEDAYNAEDLSRYNRELQDNLDLQLKAAAAAKSAAEDGKDTKENIDERKEWQREYDELMKQSAEATKEYFSEMTGGIFDDASSAAEGFVDAWLEAFKETGDGLSGLTEHFEEEFLNVVKKQLVYQTAAEYIQHWTNELSEIINPDTEFDENKFNSIMNNIRAELPELSEALEKVWDSFDVDSLGAGGLSGLQKGIQGITETQADVLTAYWNSVRQSIASIDSKFDVPLSALLSDPKFNPMLTAMQATKVQVDNIYKLLSGVLNNTGNAIKVVM